MQIVNGESYRAMSQRKVARTIDGYAVRGNIYDRNGNLLVTNDVEYVLNLYRTKKSQDDVNKLLLKIANVLLENGDSYINNFPIDLETRTFTLEDSQLSKWKKDYELDEECTEQDAIDYFSSQYRLQEYDDYNKKLLLPMRYELANKGYSSYKAVAIAKDISEQTIHKLEENNFEYTGVYISKESKRKYLYGETLSHILGYIGPISGAEYENRKDEGYTINSIVGKSGVESSFEKYLRGINGKKRIEMDSSRHNKFNRRNRR